MLKADTILKPAFAKVENHRLANFIMEEQRKNPALIQEARYEPAIVIPIKRGASLIDWLKANNRLIPREPVEAEKVKSDDDLDVLMDGDDDDFEDDDD